MWMHLMEIMEPKLEEVRKEERGEGIRKNIDILQKLKHKDEEIRAVIIEQYTR